MIPHELAKPIASAALPCGAALVIAYLLGGTTAAFLVGLLLLPLAWFTLGFVGLATAASVVMLGLAGILLAQTVLEREGSDVEMLREADADVRQARRVATVGSEAREENLREEIRRQQEELAAMTRRAQRLERRTRTLQAALSKARRKARERERGKRRSAGQRSRGGAGRAPRSRPPGARR